MGTINDKLVYLDDTKEAIKEAIQNKGVSVTNEDTFRSYAEKINSIDVSGGIASDFVMEEDYVITPNKEDGESLEEFQYDEYAAPYVDSNGEEFEGVSNIKVRKIGSWIDSEISADNIRLGHTILGVAGNVIQLSPQPTVTTKSGSTQKSIKPTGNYNGLSEVIVEPLVLQSKTVNPSSTTQIVSSSSSYDGLSTVTVNAVTADVDSDIKPENIKKDISILGVKGTYVPEPYVSETLEVTPTTEKQTFTPNEGVEGFNKVDVKGVTSSIDPNITSKNIKRGVTILGVEGSYVTENLQSKVVNPSTSQQVVTYDDDKYEGLRDVTVNAVTSDIDSDIKPENIKAGIEILGVTGEFEGENYEIEPIVTVTPQTTPVVVKPSEGYDYLSQVNIEGVNASIDPNILAENIKKNIQILGVTGTLEQHEYQFQDVKEIQPGLNDKTVTPDTNYDALLKVIVKAVTASIDPNILPKNIRKNISILGVTGTLEEGLPQKWFDFIDIKDFAELSETTQGGGSEHPTNKTIGTNNDQILDEWFENKPEAIDDVTCAIFSIVNGLDIKEVVDPTIYQTYLYVNEGSYYYDYSTYMKLPESISYLYPFVNDYGVDGCLLNCVDDGSERELNVYLIIHENKSAKVVLVEGDMSGSLLPEGYNQYRYINKITIPAHENVFEIKYDSNFDMHWVLTDRKEATSVTNINVNLPVTVDVSAYDTNFGEEETITEQLVLNNEYKTTSTSPTITNNIASSFSATKYIILDTNVDSVSYFEYTGRVYVTGGGTYNVFFTNENYGFGVSGSTSYRYWRLWSGTGNQSARYGYTNNKWYWCKLIQEGSTTKLLSILDDETTYTSIESLPPATDSAWTTQVTVNSKVFNTVKSIVIGTGYNTTTEYWRGQIDLYNCEFIINDKKYEPISKKTYKTTNHSIIPLREQMFFYDAKKEMGIPYGERPLYTGYEVVGNSVKISNDGIASGATSSSYLLTPMIIPTNAKTVRMIFNAKTPSTGHSQGICYAQGNSKYTEAYVQSTNKFKAYHDGGAIGGVTPITSTNNYWFAIDYNGTIWTGHLLIDNNNLYDINTLPDISLKSAGWTKEWEVSAPTYTYRGYKVRFMENNAEQPWRGTFDLNRCVIYVDGIKYWTPLEQKISYTPAEGSLYNYEDNGDAVDMPIWLASITRDETIVTEGTNTGTIDENGVFTATSTQTLYKTIENDLTNVEIYIKLRTPATTVTGGQRVITFGHVTSGELCPLYCALSDASTGMYVKFGSESTYMNVLPTVANDTEYYIKITYDGTTAKTYYSLTGYDDMSQVASMDFTWSVAANTIMYLTGSTESNSKGKFVGNIYLQETYIKSNDDYIWRPYYTLPSVEKKYIFAPESFTTEDIECIEQVGIAKIPTHNVFNWVGDHFETEKIITISVDDENTTIYTEVI